MPVNSTLVFYDGRRQYYSGTMPYLAIKKEINNALGNKVVYRERDNRGKEFGQPILEDNLSMIVDAIYRQSNADVGASFLNTYLLQYDRAAAQSQQAAGIKPDEKPDVENLKRIRQIQIAKARKFSANKG